MSGRRGRRKANCRFKNRKPIKTLSIRGKRAGREREKMQIKFINKKNMNCLCVGGSEYWCVCMYVYVCMCVQ